MFIRATDDQVREMCALAVNASRPAGLGFLHYRAEHQFTPEDFLHTVTPAGCYLDYVEGRMVKLRMRRVGPTVWDVPDATRDDYESWRWMYSSYRDLAIAAGACEIYAAGGGTDSQ